MSAHQAPRTRAASEGIMTSYRTHRRGPHDQFARIAVRRPLRPVDLQPGHLAQLRPGALQQLDQQFWATPGAASDSLVQETLEITLTSPRRQTRSPSTSRATHTPRRGVLSPIREYGRHSSTESPARRWSPRSCSRYRPSFQGTAVQGTCTRSTPTRPLGARQACRSSPRPCKRFRLVLQRSLFGQRHWTRSAEPSHSLQSPAC